MYPFVRQSILLPGWILFLVIACAEPDIIEDPPPSPIDVLCSSTPVEGYCNKVSFSAGEDVNVYLYGKDHLPQCGLQVYTANGDAAFTVSASLSNTANPPQDVPGNGMGYHLATTFSVPANLKSGIYLIEKKIPFIVKPEGAVDLLVVYPSNTVNAYSSIGGKSLYTTPRATEVSFHRTMPLQDFSLHCLTWFANQHQYNIGYVADHDLDHYEWLTHAKLLVIVGHSEYWTRAARMNFDRFVDEGNNALILSGNTMWWQVRYSSDEDKSRMICYKSWDDDPAPDPSLKTFRWNDPRLLYPIVSSIGADFDNGGYGLRSDNGWNGYKITRPQSPLLNGTGLEMGDILPCATTEYDGAPIASWDANGNPVPDLEKMGVMKAEIIGFDKGFRGAETHGTFLVFQRRPDSGLVINVGSTDWCSSNGMGSLVGGDLIKTITGNAIENLLTGRAVFSE